MYRDRHEFTPRIPWMAVWPTLLITCATALTLSLLGEPSFALGIGQSQGLEKEGPAPDELGVVKKNLVDLTFLY